jgi:hypothetical protein
MSAEIKTFAEFYPYYLGEHRNGVCRQLHAVGSTFALIIVLTCVYSQAWSLMGFAAVAGYGAAWIGHYFFEKNRPATFSYPLWSFAGDWVMFVDMLRGRIPFRGELSAELLHEFVPAAAREAA